MIKREEVHSLNSLFMDHERQISEMSLVLGLISNGCTFEQTKKIIGCKQHSMHELVTYYFGKSKSVYENIRKVLSDEQCLKIWLMIQSEKTELKRKYITKLMYPCFVCVFTFVSLLFFKFTLLSKIRTMFDNGGSDLAFIIFDLTCYGLIIFYMVLFFLYLTIRYLLKNPNTRNYLYLSLYDKFSDNLLTIHTSGLFSKILLECFRVGISTQTSLEILGKFTGFPFVMLLARNCSLRLFEGNTFTQAITTIETDSSFKVFIQLGLYANKVLDQLINYCAFNVNLFDSKMKNLLSLFYAFVYVQFFITTMLIYQVIQIPMAAISSRI